jgi:Fe-S cluster biogenesis protein NfuA/nitrite reductase/ring-hydroxylating ferredoxin subunit
MDDLQARERVARVEQLLDEIETLPDRVAREQCTELVVALLDLYGEALGRIMERVSEPESLTADELVSHLLMVHDLHPEPVEERIRAALEEVRPYLESHGGDVELITLDAGVVHLRLTGSCSGCPSSATTLKLAVEDAIRKAAPEIEEIRADDGGRASNAPAAAPGLIQLEPLAPRDNGSAGWVTAGVLPELRTKSTVLKEIGGERVLFLHIDGNHYAYRPGCPACGSSLEDATLSGTELECPGCGHLFDARLAGRSTDAPGIHLDPIPLLLDDSGIVKVAVTRAP